MSIQHDHEHEHYSLMTEMMVTFAEERWLDRFLETLACPRAEDYDDDWQERHPGETMLLPEALEMLATLGVDELDLTSFATWNERLGRTASGPALAGPGLGRFRIAIVDESGKAPLRWHDLVAEVLRRFHVRWRPETRPVRPEVDWHAYWRWQTAVTTIQWSEVVKGDDVFFGLLLVDHTGVTRVDNDDLRRSAIAALLKQHEQHEKEKETPCAP